MTLATLKHYRLHMSYVIRCQDYKCCFQTTQYRAIRWYYSLQVQHKPYNPFSFKSLNWCRTAANGLTSQRPFCQNTNLDFEDHRDAFKDQSALEILRSLTILRLCGIEIFSKNSLKMAEISQKLLGKRLFHKLMKLTFYGHFVAGDSQSSIENTIRKLQKRNIKTMIACTNEEDVGEKSMNEDKYDDCMNRTLECIRLVGMFEPKFPKTQIKVSGALPTQILLKLEKIDKDARILLIQAIADRLKGSLLKVPSVISEHFNEDELQQLDRGILRLKKVGEQAVAQNVVVLVDAEYTSVNPGIDILTLAMMASYNIQKPIAAYENVCSHLEIAKNLNVCFGAKIVRGAYMTQERELASRLGYSDPINESYENTSNMYQRVSDLMINNVSRNSNTCNVLIATHNEESVRFAVNKIYQCFIDPSVGAVTFAQLYGMCDQITYPLAQRGYIVYKSMPLGRVDEVLPYLYRRAMENIDVLKGSRKEVKLLGAEIKCRMRNMF